MRDCFAFDAIRGVQAGREFFVATCPLRLVPKVFLFAEEELPPALRAQRTLSKAKVPLMTKYILNNPTEYVFSSLTASFDGEAHFEPYGDEVPDVGRLSIPLSARIVINDGQHRRAAIEEALRQAPQLGTETISVVFFQDLDLARCQQMFADLNRHAARPTKSLSILYDYRDPLAQLVRRLAMEVPVFKNLTEMEKTSISNRSVNLFTLNSIYQATSTFLRRVGLDPRSEQAYATALQFWTALGTTILEWTHVQLGEVSSAATRANFIHAHGVTLQALGRAGGDLLSVHQDDWERHLARIRKIDWSRRNTQVWEGRALVSGRITKGERNIVLIANVVKCALTLPLNTEEQRVETRFGQELPEEVAS